VKACRIATSCRTPAPAIREPALAPQGRPVSGSGSEVGWMPLQQAVGENSWNSRRASTGWQRVGSMDLPVRFLPPLYTYTMPGRCHAQRLVFAPPTHATQTLAGGPRPASQTVWAKQIP
jgi:hypothetical protein